MYSHRERERERGTVPSKSELDRKRISDVLDRSSPSTSKVINGGKDRSSVKSSSYTNTDSRSASNPISKNSNASDESETDSEGSDISGSDGDDTSWITWFCNLRGNEFFCEVDDDYIQDDFNLCGLSSQVPYYDYALDLILDVESSHGDMFTEEQNELIESAAEMLYGLIHARFILTSKGMAAMLDKYKNYDFGRCPRVYCSGQTCLPVGQSDIARSSTVKIYCPRNIGVIACMCHCFAVYNCDLNLWWQLFCSLCFPIFLDSIIDIDGAYFGTTFPHLFLMTYGQLRPQKPSQNYVQRVFGFKLHKPQS